MVKYAWLVPSQIIVFQWKMLERNKLVLLSFVLVYNIINANNLIDEIST